MILLGLIPFLLLGTLASLWSAALTATGRLTLPALTPALTPLCAGLAVLFFGAQHGIEALVVGMIFGAACECAVTGTALARAGLLVWPRPAHDRALRPFAGETAQLIAGSAVLGLIPLADQVMAGLVGQGSLAAFGYASRLVALASGIGAIALSQAALPAFAALAARRDITGLARLTRQTAVTVLGLGLFAALLLALASAPLTALLYERGAFTQADTARVAAIQAAYGLHVPFFLAWLVLARALAVLGRARALLVLSTFAALLNVALNLALTPWGVVGIATATALVFATTVAATAIIAARAFTQARA